MDKQRKLKEMIMELDRQFDKETSVGGVEVWASYFTQESVMIIAHGEDIKGRENICNYMVKSFSLPGFSLRWEPIDAKISEDGGLGYTYGRYLRKYIDAKGNEISSIGKYTTVWEHQGDKTWKIILDIGN